MAKNWILHIPPIPAVSQKASSDDISGAQLGSIDPPVSKQPEKIPNKKKTKINVKKWSKMVKNSQKRSKWFQMVPNGPK